MTMQNSIKPIGNQINRGVSFIIYADPGVGKTTMCTTLPAGETLFINAEAGLGPLLGTNHSVFPAEGHHPNWLTDLDKMNEYLRTVKHPFKYVVLDNMSDIEQKIIQALTDKRNKETPELREYGDSAFKLREHITNYRDLNNLGINVVFTAWEQLLDIKTDAGLLVTKTYPKVSKKVAPEFCGKVDVVGHLEVEEKSGRRWLRVGPSDQYCTKTQFKGLDDGEVADFPTLFEKILDYEYSTVGETVAKEVKKQGGK